MASLPSGSDQLIHVETPSISLTIKGPDFAQEAHLVDTSQETALVRLMTRDPASLIVRGKETPPNQLQVRYVRPLLRDQRNYEIIIENKSEEPAAFWHESLALRQAVTPVDSRKRILTGVLNFRNEIGYTDLVVRVSGHDDLRLTVEVFPGKIDYRQDYQALLTDLTKELYNLIFDFLQRTYAEYGTLSGRKNSLVEFFAIIRKIYRRMLLALDIILHQPQHKLQRESRVMSADRNGRATAHTIYWLEQHPQYVHRRPDGSVQVERARMERRTLSYDTKENRFVRFMLERTCQRLQILKKQYGALARETDESVITEITRMIQQLQARIQRSFLANIEAKPERLDMSLVFLMAPGYRNLYRCYLLLQRGLSVQGGLFHISIKDVAELYEYWCFIKLNHLLKERYDLVSQDIIKVQQRGLFVSLVKGQRSHVHYRNPRTGEQIQLLYNPRTGDSPTVAQKPDNVLSLQKRGAGTQYEYVFDAKYRINPAVPGSWYAKNIDKQPGPEADDINTMHRYRDAIVYQSGASPYEQKMFGAYVLFPYRKEERYQKHRFYKSIAQVNIGGVPFLPSATKLAERLLDELVGDSPDMAFARAVLPEGIEQRLAHVDWSKRDVLIGAMRNQAQFAACRKGRFYHIPLRTLTESALPIHTIALYQSKNLFHEQAGIFYYGEVTQCRIVPRSAIQEIPRRSEEPYFYFTVKEWKPLPHPIQPKELGFVFLLTNHFLLMNSHEVPELRLRSEAEFRLYDALRRISAQTAVNEDTDGISLHGWNFAADGQWISLYHDDKLVGQWPADRFRRQPWHILREIQQQIKRI